jgi:hypothetical protein
MMRLFSRKVAEPQFGNCLLDLDEWIERSRSVDASCRRPRTTFSPIQFLDAHLARQDVLSEIGVDSGNPMPVEYIAWSLGEPVNRSATKVGGLPYRPRNLPWPIGHDDSMPMDFLAQFNFSNSQDIFQNLHLPGDVLLIFRERHEDRFHTEWHRHGLNDLVRPRDVPQIPESFPGEKAVSTPMFGHLWRTSDYPELGTRDDQQVRTLACLSASKIGGMPGLLPPKPFEHSKFLCKLASIQVPVEFPWPFVNSKRAPKPSCSWSKAYNALMIGDLGALYCFADERGNVACVSQCH